MTSGGGGGGGVPVLLLHGQPGRARDWDRVLAEVSRIRNANLWPIASDRPGWNGHTAAVDLAANAEVALGALDAAGAAEALVVGHSFGGAVACWLAAERPDRVSGLVLLAPSANTASIYALDRWLAAPVVGDLIAGASLAGAGVALAVAGTRRRIAQLLRLDDDFLADAGRTLLNPATWRSFVAEQRVLVNDLPALELRLARITAPTRIVVGSADRVVGVGSAKRLADQIPGAQLTVVQGAGHLLPLQQAGEVAQIIATAALEDARTAGVSD